MEKSRATGAERHSRRERRRQARTASNHSSLRFIGFDCSERPHEQEAPAAICENSPGCDASPAAISNQ